MITKTINIARYRIKISIAGRRGAKNDFILQALREVSGVRIGNKLPRFVRLTVERIKVRRFIGTHIAILVLTTNVVAPSVAAFNSQPTAEPEVVAIAVPDAPVETIVNRRYPVEKLVISQGYRIFHPALDIDGVTGDLIYPIMNGQVESAGQEFLLGKTIRIKHTDNTESVYAHLDKINVKSGQEVTTGSKIGEMGNTGHSFGDHLHLESIQALF